VTFVIRCFYVPLFGVVNNTDVNFRTAGFQSFLKYVLIINPRRRPTAQQLLEVSHASSFVLPDVIIDGQVVKLNEYYFLFNHDNINIAWTLLLYAAPIPAGRFNCTDNERSDARGLQHSDDICC